MRNTTALEAFMVYVSGMKSMTARVPESPGIAPNIRPMTVAPNIRTRLKGWVICPAI